MDVVRYRSRCARYSHHDVPDTDADFRHLANLSPGADRCAVRDRLMKAWLPMAHRLAAKYRNRGEALEDLQQVAAVGLFKAVDRYDPAAGPFTPFAVPTILGELRRHFRDNTWDLRVPRRVQEFRNRVRRAVHQLSQGGRAPSLAQLAEHTGMSEEDVQLVPSSSSRSGPDRPIKRACGA